jgi:starch synthase (maltosyl-transferring)
LAALALLSTVVRANAAQFGSITMRACNHPVTRSHCKGQLFAPRIYYFDPLLGGPRSSWSAHLSRCKELGFTHLLSAPLFDPGQSGDLFLTSEHERVNPAILPASAIDSFIAEFARSCQEHDLALLLDVVVGRVSTDSAIARSKPEWFRAESAGIRADPRDLRRRSNALLARFDDLTTGKQICAWWIERLVRLARAGVAGFRCEDPGALPPNLWRHLIKGIRRSAPDCRFLAWTPGLGWQTTAGLADVGFDAAFSSVPWWDGRADWFVAEHELLRGLGAVIGCPEVPYGPRLMGRVQSPAEYRHLLRRAAAVNDGIMIPMGLEWGASLSMDRRGAASDSISDKAGQSKFGNEIREAIGLTNALARRGIAGEMRPLTAPDQAVTALLRSDTADVRQARRCVAALINTDFQHEQSLPIALDPLPSSAGIAAVADAPLSTDCDWQSALAPGEIRLIDVRPSAPLKTHRSATERSALTKLPRIVIDNVAPTVDQGRFAAKRVIGDTITVEADVFTDGHDLLAVDLLWRAVETKKWRRASMQPIGNDRWQSSIRPDRIGRYEFTIEADWDRYGSFCRDLAVKSNAGADVTIEMVEGRKLLEERRIQNGTRGIIDSALARLAVAHVAAGVEIFLSDDLRQAMQLTEDASFRVRYERALPLDVERPQATFAAWYELFPRSATDDPNRHGTFRDVIRHLPRIKEMGFDVLYLPPIHPIGLTNRKGKNNSLTVTPEDVGSPYAIGGAEGGHDAIHSALGTIEGFRLLREACAAHGIELALDFAIQCSPDHPWLKQHPEWFNWRPDGTVRYAENPPKKYEDIVNIDFLASTAFPDLWMALRDIVLYWRSEGVRIFRVDNPHTKPLPFWEWLIADVRGAHPDVIFLSEAFTRPKMMYRLAKAGFSQSYTYFTWRNTKHELTDYFSELTTESVSNYFRPHLFVNTPDINPYFLQTSGRPGFLIRAALAATLSGLWGMYSGFELCEAAALPGREEYLDSEKYQIRARNYDAPGNIAAEIAKLNRIRHSNPALQTHLGLKFYPAHDDRVLLYGKRLPNQQEMILVAVNLDPFHAHDVTIEVPVWEWQRPDHATMKVRDLMRDTLFTWHGKLQRLRLDPVELPFAIWRITPSVGA